MERIDKALSIAARHHQGQRRKDRHGTPYIAHPAAVGLMLQKYGGDEDVIVAGILHDILEDTPYTEEDLEKDFGPRVLSLVAAVSEPKRNSESDLPWKERKLAYLDNLRKGPHEALLISAADKLHNLMSLERELTSMGAKEFFERFMYREPQSTAWFYGEAVKIVEEKFPDHELTVLLRKTHDRVVPLLKVE